MQNRFVINILTAGLLIYLVLSALPGFGQSHITEDGVTEFGNIPDSLYEMQQYKQDPSAPYVYTLKEVDIHFEEDNRSIIAVLNYHVRIKVFDASARQVSVVAIPYYFEQNIEEIKNIRGVTYSGNGNITKLTEDQIRTININSRYNVKEFNMPEVEDGSILEYSYQIRRRYIEELPDFFLTHQAPTLLARASITYPHYLRYDVIPVDYDGTIHHETQEIDTSSVTKIFTIPQPDPIIKEIWSARNVPALEEEAYISSIDDYRGKMKFKLSEFGNPRQKLENSWDFVVAELRRNQNITEKISENEKAAEIGRSIGREFNNLKEVQDSIFNYVNKTAVYNGSNSPFSEKSDEEVLSGELANQAAINQTLTAMLKGAEIEAYPVLISTREFGQIDRSFPSLFQFNGQLVYSHINGKSYFMDASFAYSQPNLIPVTTYNEMGLLLRPKSYEWKDIAPLKSKFHIDISVDAALDSQGNLSGEITSQSSGYPAQLVREKFSSGKDDASIIREAVFDGYNEVELSDASLSDLYDYDKPIGMNARFLLENYATSFSDGLEFRPMVVGFLMSNPFNEGDRDLPVTLDAPEKLNLVYQIRIPEGYAFKKGVENRSIQLPGASFKESYQVEARTIRYEFNINISQKRFEPDVYPQLLDLYERWVDLSTGKWLIKKQ